MARFFSHRKEDLPILVIGLGRFGYAVAWSLVCQGREVMAVDTDAVRVQRYADELTRVVQADATDEDALEQIGAREFEYAVVAIGNDIEASVLATLSLAKAKVPHIWARAVSRNHGEILNRVGAHHVVYPETSVGEQVAHAIAGGMSQYIEFEDGYVIARMTAPRETWNKTFDESGVRTKYGVTVVGLKRAGKDFIYARPETLVEPGDEFIVAGLTRKIETFCALTSE